MNPDRLAELEEQRRFLLRSLADLEREYLAGDIDAADYRELTDGYTARTAQILRAIEQGKDALPAARRANWARRVLIVGVTAILAGITWWALAASSAQRLPGQEITGASAGVDTATRLAQARSMALQQPGQAAVLYEAVLVDDPTNVEALTYGGWTRALAVRFTDDIAAGDLAAELQRSVEMLSEAISIDPTYPDPYCLRGVLVARFLERPESAIDDLDVCLEKDPPADIAALVLGLRQSIDETNQQAG